MARHPRLDLAGMPKHSIQPGNNRLPCFLDAVERRTYLHLLAEALHQSGYHLHGGVLKGNHVHLRLTPLQAGATGALMQRFGRNYVPLFNARHGRTGTLWEGRYKACLVGDDNYLLTCMRYIELNPVRAGMVADPADYPWSSHHATAHGREAHRLQPHPSWLTMDQDPIKRQQRWRAFVMAGITDDAPDPPRLCLQRQHPYDSDRFRADIDA